MTRTVLILGARGSFGIAATRAFLTAGWTVRAATRDGKMPIDHAALRPCKADDDTQANGAAVIVHALNQPYADWEADARPALARTLRLAEAAGARVILPGNVYVFGTDMPSVLTTTTPHRATNPLGRIRRQMEQMLIDSPTQTLVLRAGDFLGGEAGGNWMDMVMAKGLARGKLTYPGPTDRAHAWAWLPDVARAAAALADRPWPGGHTDVPFAGLTLTGAELAGAIADVLGRPVRPAGFPWLVLQAGGLVRRDWRHLVEMRYLWQVPHLLDPAPLRALLPDFTDTPRDKILTSMLVGLGYGSAISTQTSLWSDETTLPDPTSA